MELVKRGGRSGNLEAIVTKSFAGSNVVWRRPMHVKPVEAQSPPVGVRRGSSPALEGSNDEVRPQQLSRCFVVRGPSAKRVPLKLAIAS
ncbi:hypothetical protein TNCV_1715982 [Trichonephila clavipes]|nr:hypothetical protein TNCV_1715982 [Trichonephila clavipes]